MTGSEILLSRAPTWEVPVDARGFLTRAISPGPNGGLSVRFAIVGERRFRIERETYGGLWFVSEVFADGRDIWIDANGDETPDARSRGADHDMKFLATGVRLSAIRDAIAAEVTS